MKTAEGSTPSDCVTIHLLTDDGTFPNNARLPLLVYARALVPASEDPASAVEAVFHANGWGGGWRNGVFDYHHYHATAHEVLGVYSGTAEIQFGGPGGPVVPVGPGDAVVIPAGVAHCSRSRSDDFRVVGAYPRGQRWDMNTGRPGERPRADHHIAIVPLPDTDPVQGRAGALRHHWWQPATE